MQKTAIVLVPEISLTPQMLDRFISRFGKEKIAVLHSKLSIGERHDEWERIKKAITIIEKAPLYIEELPDFSM